MGYEDRYDAMSDFKAEQQGMGYEEGKSDERERILKILHSFVPYTKYKILKEAIERNET